ncbi:hypothetical protein DL238_00580 [Alteriqipengyuania lutimaris]|uniref:Uncharacterized protein n=1 Tax=Alteriqipengyuania lutimaris TaxID=1538146 RepID=A0A395LHW5_9SPHN|nr:hypothetical protein DL238_00580 [Alteriqipengyuania lutimaris]
MVRCGESAGTRKRADTAERPCSSMNARAPVSLSQILLVDRRETCRDIGRDRVPLSAAFVALTA